MGCKGPVCPMSEVAIDKERDRLYNEDVACQRYWRQRSGGHEGKTMMEYKGYVARVQFDDDANIFHGEVTNIRDVVTFQGRSVAELRQALQGSVEDYLAFCAERGELPNQPYSGWFTVRLAPEQYRKVILAADRAGKDVNRWVVDAMEYAVEFARA